MFFFFNLDSPFRTDITLHTIRVKYFCFIFIIFFFFLISNEWTPIYFRSTIIRVGLFTYSVFCNLVKMLNFQFYRNSVITIEFQQNLIIYFILLFPYYYHYRFCWITVLYYILLQLLIIFFNKYYIKQLLCSKLN